MAVLVFRKFPVRVLLLGLLALAVVGCGSSPVESQSLGEEALVCQNGWYQKVDALVVSSDGAGHGPDLGSLEWRSVVEFKLGIRGDEAIPDKAVDAWCTYIDRLIVMHFSVESK